MTVIGCIKERCSIWWDPWGTEVEWMCDGRLINCLSDSVYTYHLFQTNASITIKRKTLSSSNRALYFTSLSSFLRQYAFESGYPSMRTFRLVYFLLIMFYFLLFTFYFFLFTFYFLLFTFYFLLFTFYFLLFTFYILLFTFYFSLFTFYFLLFIFYFLLFTFYFLFLFLLDLWLMANFY